MSPRPIGYFILEVNSLYSWRFDVTVAAIMPWYFCRARCTRSVLDKRCVNASSSWLASGVMASTIGFQYCSAAFGEVVTPNESLNMFGMERSVIVSRQAAIAATIK